MNFVTGLSVLINKKSKSYNFISVIVKRLPKMVYYKPVKVTIDILRLAKTFFNVVIWHYGLFNSIITN